MISYLIRRFFLFLVSSLFIINAGAQPGIKNYNKEWKAVDDYVKKRLPKSALTQVMQIYAMAKRDKQDAQLIKSVVYMTQLQTETREDNETLSIREWEKEIAASKEPVTSILNSLLAEMYLQYYEQNRWELYDRTETVNFKKDDISMWSTEDFHKKISELYLQSLKNEKLLQDTRLEPFNAILVKGNVRHLRPTLFDLLANRALQYFENDERDIKKPAYAFEISEADAFAPAAEFISHKFITQDSLSLQHKALLIYQRLLSFHLKDARPDALIDADLLRLGFVKAKSVHPDKEQLYFKALEHIANKYGDLPAAAQAWYLMAAWYEGRAGMYTPHGDTTHRYDRVKAKAILERIVAQKDSSEGKINSINLLKNIREPRFQFNVEKVNVPGEPFRSLVQYRNLNQLYLRIIKPDENLKKLLENPYDQKYWSSVVAASPLRSWQQALPATNDLQEHRVEIKIDALPAGEYLLVASASQNLADKKALVGARMFYVSNISYVNNYEDFFVLNRNSGQPLGSAAVQVWEQKYDYKQSKYIKEKVKLYKTDANGFFRLERTQDKNTYANHSYLLDITHGGERFFLNDIVYDYYYIRREMEIEYESTTSVFLFTDRSIYRPGQTLFFKGIALGRNQKEKRAVVLENYTWTVVLQDANGQALDSMRLKTNEFGSFSGKFQLPSTGLNGDFSIYVRDKGSASFQVEEYKRPKFYVDFEPIKGTYQVNDLVKLTGFAKAYAGNNIDNASVSYRVVRQPRYLYPWMFWRWWQPPTAPMEIAHGEVKTDENGKYVIEFKAIPDLTIDKKFDPVFDYTVYADITDINGETRSGEQMVSVSYKALRLNVSLPERLPVDSLRSLSIRTENMNGEFEPATITVTIIPLKEEKRLIRQRYWERPDQFVMTRDEYIRLFPHDEYDNESDYRSWEEMDTGFMKTDSSRRNGQWALSDRFGNWKFDPGFYMVEVTTKDKNGQEVKDIKYVELYDEKSNKLNRPEYLWSEGAKPIEPGEKTAVKLGTAADNVFMIHEVNKQDNSQKKTSDYSFTRLNDENRVFEFGATEADRGGYGANWLFIKHNRFYQYNQTIVVPWSNKELKIEYATYRDKTLPGSEEKWKLKISGYKNELVAAEMLAGMYDASLDQFYPHGWTEPGIWSNYYNDSRWDASRNFAAIESVLRYTEEKEPAKYVKKEYDYIIYSRPDYRGNQYYGDFFGERYAYGLAGKVSGLNVEYNMSANKVALDEVQVSALPPRTRKQEGVLYDSASTYQWAYKDGKESQKSIPQINNAAIQIRKNFNETAFFFPELRTDASGAIEFSFTMPEALTQWKFMALAHTKDAAFGTSTKEIITQKQLMVQPNAPRFLREGDKMEFSSKIVNLSERELNVVAELQLLDAATNQPVNSLFKNTATTQSIKVAAGQSAAVKFPIEIPYQFNKALVWRIMAKAAEFSDGEENALPVLTNRMLVTETMPLPMRGSGTKNFTFEKLLKSGDSKTLQHHALTVEYTSNPAWYAVQALPYLMEYPYECAEQTWNRYYANALASYISKSSPRIQQVFEQWKIKDTAALMSNLQKNQELKSLLLEETPWVLEAKNETEQKKNIALLFDMMKMGEQLQRSFEKLREMQSENGGFVWFKGGPDDRYITQYIVTGIGHLQKLIGKRDYKLEEISSSAIPYLDEKIRQDYENLIKYKVDLKKYNPDYIIVQYLYMRSFFPEHAIARASQMAYNYFRSRMQQSWTGQSKYMQGMIALALHRTGDKQTPQNILKSLKETSINNEELGMYWKDQVSYSWFWYQAPIETQALMIEAFQEIGKDIPAVDDLKTWLLKNKQTNNWKTTRATAEACYALLLQGTDWLSYEPEVEIKSGGTVLASTRIEKPEAGTGYIKRTIEGPSVQPSLGNISVTVKRPSYQSSDKPLTGASWGAVYWQYFEDLDKITTAATPLKLEKKLFIEKNTDRGPVLTPVNDGDVLKVGDKIKVRVELRVDRDMEYVHMKDMRASALEPVNVLSGYKWQGGLGYYETTRDASTNFFFDYLRKGSYVFEYALFVTHAGNFSNGITTIQCMYAPEFSAHSEGVRVTVK